MGNKKPAKADDKPDDMTFRYDSMHGWQ